MSDSIAQLRASDAGQAGQTNSSTALTQRYLGIRSLSERMASPLTAEDCAMQTMPDVSPTRWHLAHTTWFFEVFLLKNRPGYKLFDPEYEQLFNSYYNAVGRPFPRHRRGQLSRPGLSEILAYRRHVDEAVTGLLEGQTLQPSEWDVLQLGMQHEQQHQELILTDIKHVFFSNPLQPAYQAALSPWPSCSASAMRWAHVEEGVFEIGYQGSGFAYDNERPRHRTLVQSHSLASRCVTNGEYLEFIDDDGYSRPELWLSLGWAQLVEQRWMAPLYWVSRDQRWHEFTLAGLTPLNREQPVCHISYFEADAFARWADRRLPTEFEWEAAASAENAPGVFADKLLAGQMPIHPQVQTEEEAAGLLGNVWQWTSSHYSPYPRYRAAAGALGEYNGKFMCNQFVLRGGSCATSSDHIRATYRNFFPPETRWQFSGIRLARD